MSCIFQAYLYRWQLRLVVRLSIPCILRSVPEQEFSMVRALVDDVGFSYRRRRALDMAGRANRSKVTQCCVANQVSLARS